MPPTTRTVAPSLPDLLRAHPTYSNTLTSLQSTSIAKSPKSKKAKLVELDKWFRGTLREDLKGKGKERVGLDKDQLKRLMEWKLTVSNIFCYSVCIDTPLSMRYPALVVYR